jgi:hypothetical protein
MFKGVQYVHFDHLDNLLKCEIICVEKKFYHLTFHVNKAGGEISALYKVTNVNLKYFEI